MTDPTPAAVPAKHLDTENVRRSVARKAVQGAAVLAIARPIRVAVNVAGLAVLARILTPYEFGLFGMVAIVMRFMDTFRELGFGTAVIQRDDVTNAQMSGLFWMNAAVATGLGLALGLASPLVARFYGEPGLNGITRYLAISFALGGLSVQHQALLRRQMRFVALSVIDVAAFALATGLAVLLAYEGWGTWSLVGRTLANAIFLSGMTWLAVRWVPELPRKTPGLGKLVRFGANISGFNLLNFFSRNADNLVVGKFFGAQALGFYEKSYDLMMLSLKHVSGPAASVAVPALSRLQKEPERYRDAYFDIVDKILLVSMPFGAVMLAASEELVTIVLGHQWLAAVPIVRAFGIVILVQPISSTLGWLFTTQDRTSELMTIGFTSAVGNVASFLIGAYWGPIGVAWAFSIGQLVRTPTAFWMAGRRGPVAQKDLYGALATFLFAAAWGLFAAWVVRMGVLSTHFGTLPKLGPAIVLVAASTAAGLGFLAALAIVPRGRRALRGIPRALRHLLKR